MKFIIEGSQSELTELIKRLGGIETEAKKVDFPPLLTELAESNSIGKNGKAKPRERLFIDLAPNFQAALEKFCGDKKIDEPEEAVRNADKENAPQVEAAEQDYKIRYFNTTAEELEKTAHDISERRAIIESMRS